MLKNNVNLTIKNLQSTTKMNVIHDKKNDNINR